jgi:RES domain-containing protein
MAFDPTAISTVPLRPVQRETYYRSVSVQALVDYKAAKFLSGEHSGKAGGRYNSPGQDPTLYLSGSQTLASLEAEQAMFYIGLATVFPGPRLVSAVRVEDANVLDLTSPFVCTTLGIPTTQLTQATPIRTALNAAGSLSLTQMIGDAARHRPDCDGLLAPSWLRAVLDPSFPRPENLILFLDPLSPDHARRAGVRFTVSDTSPRGLIAQLDAMGA